MRNDALNEWLANGERGISSETIVQHLTGRVQRHWRSEPHDLGDFRRCERLLRQVPLLRLALPGMADLSPAWAALVERWDEIVALCEEEAPGYFDTRRPDGRAAKAGSLIRQCREVVS